jgi:release factor glutamine methyltransferase
MSRIETALQQATSKLQGLTDSPKADAEILLAFVMQKPRSYLRAWPERMLETSSNERFWRFIQLRMQGTPIAYLTGYREFWSREFKVTPDVLIPRPDTELLVDLALQSIPKAFNGQLLDLGTGSGIIAITLAAERPHAQVTATDRSFAALEIARFNAKRYQIDNIRFFQTNWFKGLATQHFDVIVSNPPYIAENDSHLSQGDLRFEPLTSLCSGQDGLADIRLIIEQSLEFLKSEGRLLVEHGYDQGQSVQKIFRDLGYDNIETFNDLSGQARVTLGQLL